MNSKAALKGEKAHIDNPETRSEHEQMRIRAFRSLPSGRAVVGALLITTAAVGAFVLAGRNEVDRRIPYLVAVHQIAPGHQLVEEDLETQLIDLPAELAEAAFTNPSDLVGAAVLGPIGAGEVFWQTGITPPIVGDGEPSLTAVEFSFAVESERAPRTLRPGEHIAMLSTTGRDDTAETTVVVADAVVTDVETDSESFASAGDVTITISLADPSVVLAAVNAAQATDVTIIRIPGDGSLSLPNSSTAETVTSDELLDGD